MKVAEKRKARQLRKKGLKISEIAHILQVAKSSVSIWVRDIELSEDQKKRIFSDNKNGSLGALAMKNKHRCIREEYQAKGRLNISQCTPQYIAGCMLYWSEGAKKRNQLKFVNSDVNMMVYFLEFIRECFKIEDKEIKLRIYCYTNNGLTFEQIKDFWLKKLGLENNNIRKCSVNNRPTSSSGNKKGKLVYGTSSIEINRTDILQTIYGSIQEFCGFQNTSWIE